MLQLREINQAYDDHHTLWDINLEVSQNSCSAIVGQQGTGKTTLFHCILGFLPIMSGEMTWQPQNTLPCSLISLPSQHRSQLGITYVPQGSPIFSQLSVEENLLIALKAGHPRSLPVTLPRLISELFPILLTERHQRSGALAKGLQYQLALARAVITHPKLILLDEPSEGLTASEADHLVAIIAALTKDYNISVLLMDNNLAFVTRVADHFTLLHHGRSVMSGTAADLVRFGGTEKWSNGSSPTRVM
ncbi:ABC transporter ATP-binding protein [Rosenbergiella nectarea]|uniref:ABC transporter ATP-binding protein n=1 Tax=Rosenbergiella nectarea TaxID=988801 RepID=UPI001BDA0C60|nr:ATP-binding cassette domain-containing protein [Rosenbergiella nectarea]MBT0730739.1 ATP-binding cassette domain-containing protein [Rosenbergiella nectarea subsp. apis]